MYMYVSLSMGLFGRSSDLDSLACEAFPLKTNRNLNPQIFKLNTNQTYDKVSH